eukprot:PhF_6_TR26145/c0_g1_i2/m.37037
MLGCSRFVLVRKKAVKSNSGWSRCGDNVAYYENRWMNSVKSKYYSLTWSFVAEFGEDVLYFSHCYPYTYTQLSKFLNFIMENPERRAVVNRRTLCATTAGNQCEVLNVTQPVSSVQQLDQRKAIVMTARVHPGETNSSWILQGVIEGLTETTSLSVYLRERYVFKIIPMLNPDGVIVGNYRNTVTGKDANRTWRAPTETCSPCVLAAKNMITTTHQHRGVDLFIDFHGHNRKPNCFVYGCPEEHAERTPPNVFPFILSRLCDFFDYRECNFYVPPCKLGTARVVLAKDIGIPLSYTLEASFLGPTIGEFRNTQFTTHHYINLGRMVLEGIARMTSSQSLERYIGMAGEVRQEESDGSDDGGNLTSDDEDTIPKSKTPAPTKTIKPKTPSTLKKTQSAKNVEPRVRRCTTTTEEVRRKLLQSKLIELPQPCACCAAARRSVHTPHPLRTVKVLREASASSRPPPPRQGWTQ